tara:strand:- start:433 stop:564 length:132 start_codon:yes stop_codon:yes gene_type:complete
MSLTNEKRLEFNEWIEEGESDLCELAEYLIEHKEHDWAFCLYL